MTEKLAEILIQSGALGAVCWLLIVTMGKKIDRLHDAIIKLMVAVVQRNVESDRIKGVE